MGLFRKKKGIKINQHTTQEISDKRADIPDDLFDRCPKCRRILVQNQVNVEHLCPHCGHHLQFPAEQRISWLCDTDTFEEWDHDLTTENPIDFPGYEEKIEKAQKTTGLNEAVVTGQGQLNNQKFAIGVMDSRFIMASMGTVVGEKITRLFEQALERKLPVILYIASGGARMQEGILSLMQMTKISQAISDHGNEGLFYLPILTHPTTGGVTASFAMQGDVTLAEPDATIGFAGKRVIQQTINTQLPINFQKAETMLDNGFIDNIVSREDQLAVIGQLLEIHAWNKQ